ncbi:efflux RND transporter periplasmic adaptor subunit [Ramlibacter sp. MAHUQ-53]|uniref:efflux RND transporter periplasmic adaptor subunit n=1 Tax=unclassified Ramlibacter TaxID=2617605 RepID=UPI00362D6B5A
MATRPLYTVVAAVGIAAASGAAWWYQNKPQRPADAVAGAAAPAASGAASGPARAPSVEVAKVEVARLVDDAQAVGTLRSRQNVVVRPEVSGRIAQINFRDGQRVKRGQVMVQLDDELPRAQVAQARAELSIAQANHKRNQELVAQNFISQRSVDESGAALQVAQAKLALAEATANRLRILAPFDGIAGIRSVNVGDYLKDGADIVNLEDLDAILVDYRLPERFQTKLRPGQVAKVGIDALPGRSFNARILAIDPLVDANGRSVGVRGCIDNRLQQLRPGMFARVTAVFGERSEARVVPEEAIVPQGGRQFVIKVADGADGKVAQRVEVKVGLRLPGKVEILEGLEPGDTVVVAGQQRVQRDGMAVRVVEPGRGPGNGAAPGASAPAGAASGAAAPNATAASAPAAAVAATPAPAAAASARAAGRPEPKPEGVDPCLALLGGGPGTGAGRDKRS